MGIIAFKGFEDNLTCRGFQYEVGKTYKFPVDEAPVLCYRGFHASIMLPEAFNYYPPMIKAGKPVRSICYEDLDECARSSNRYCEVELDGFWTLSFLELIKDLAFARMHRDKLCAAQITIKRELSEEDIKRAWMVQVTNPSFFIKDKDSVLWYTCDESCEGAVTFEEFWNNAVREKIKAYNDTNCLIDI